MGTFCDYSGNISIPEELKKEFNENMIKLLNRGGMVQFEHVQMYGQKIDLITPVEVDETGKAHFFYNYNEDDSWESAIFFTDENRLGSGKIGSGEFNRVMCAANLLYELYSEDYGLMEMDGDILNPVPYIAWINHVLKKDFTAEYRFNLWKLYEFYYLNQIEHNMYDEDADTKIIYDIIPKQLSEGMGGRDLVDIYYIVNGTEDLKADDIEAGSYPGDVLAAKCELVKLFSEYGVKEKDNLYNLLELPYEKRNEFGNNSLTQIAEMTLKLPARVFVYLSAEILKFDFWKEWYNIHDQVYMDEIAKEYVSNDIIEKRNNIRKTKIGTLKTAEFLKMDGYFTFNDDPEELKDKPNYYISDDDLIYWWDGSDDVVLSNHMIDTIKKWSEELKDIEAELNEDSIADYDMLKSLIDLLSQANSSYKRIFAFRDMFYEFIENNKNIHYIAAVKLFEKILDDNWEAGKIIERVGRWEFASKNVTFNEGRITVKRYLSLLANKKLRKKYLEF